MTFISAGAIGTAAVGASQLGIAAAQYFHNKKKLKQEEANRPQYEIPQEVYQNLNQAQQQALQGLPEEQKQQYLSNLQRSSSYALGQAGTRKAGLAGVSAINEQQNTGYGNMLAQDSAARMQNQQQLMGQRQNVADYKGQEYQLNKLNPYYEHIASRQANEGALTQNLMKTTSFVGSNLANMYKPKLPSTTTPPTTTV